MTILLWIMIIILANALKYGKWKCAGHGLSLMIQLTCGDGRCVSLEKGLRKVPKQDALAEIIPAGQLNHYTFR